MREKTRDLAVIFVVVTLGVSLGIVLSHNTQFPNQPAQEVVDKSVDLACIPLDILVSIKELCVKLDKQSNRINTLNQEFKAYQENEFYKYVFDSMKNGDFRVVEIPHIFGLPKAAS